MTDDSAPLGAVEIFQRSFRLLFANFHLWVAAMIPALIGTGLDVWLMAQTAPTGAPGDPSAFSGMSDGQGIVPLIILTASLVLNAFFTGYLCLMGVDIVIGRAHSVGEYARQAARHLLPVLVLSFALGLLIGLGALLFVVPGLYFIGRYLPWIQAVVFEDLGWAGLGRAQALTKEYRWPVVGVVLLVGVVVVVIAGLIGASTAAMGEATMPMMIVSTALSTFCYALFALVTALVYVRLRGIKEGRTVDEIAESIG